MHATTPLKALSKSLHYLLVFLSDNIVTVASFVILGLATLAAHKSVEELRLAIRRADEDADRVFDHYFH